jgi:fatty acid desaturase
MNVKQLGLEAVLIGFLGLNAYVIYQYGYIGFLEQALTNAATVAVFVDLTIALSLVLLWMWQDARERGVSVLPYIALTFVLGSVGPLLYLIRRFSKESTLFTNPQAARL